MDGKAAALGLGNVRKRRGGYADAALAGVVIAVVALMVVPLPTPVLDLLLAANLAFSVTLLLIALYVGDALKIASFPTLLLITTLVRLALNVSSTRLILLQADAGSVIRAFGQFVVRGNYVVGAVIFLILTIIQFVVIAKGAERVAEVGARFTLDAMPCKQMAIDAELRSGAIDSAEARRRRRALGRESQFYGAMDGAMKFVKGDTIASFLITIVNILGGLAIGVGMKDMTAGAALQKYGLLTIGDGLVSQIPALVIATASGVLVTRVASEEAGTPLGEELGKQLFGSPQALRVAAIFVALLGLVPGLPIVPFLVIGAVLFFVSRQRRPAPAPTAPSTGALRDPTRATDNDDGQRDSPRFLPVVVPWSLACSSDLTHLKDDVIRSGNVERVGLTSSTVAVQELTFRSLGVPLPPCRVEEDASLPERHIVLALHEVPALVLPLPDDVPDDEIAEHVLGHIMPVVGDRASDFVGMTETQFLLDQLEQVAPAAVRQVVPKPVPLVLLSEVLRRLVEEHVSIRDLSAILEALAQVAPSERDPLTLTELVRSHLRRQITHDLAGLAGRLPVILLDPMIEDTIRGAIARTPSGSFLTLAPAAGRDIVRAVARALDTPTDTPAGVVLTQADIRRFVRKLLETDHPDIRVVSANELLPEVVLSPTATANLIGID